MNLNRFVEIYDCALSETCPAVISSVNLIGDMFGVTSVICGQGRLSLPHQILVDGFLNHPNPDTGFNIGYYLGSLVLDANYPVTSAFISALF